MGWMLPVVMMLRILIQELWKRGFDWDDAISEELVRKFTKALDNLTLQNKIRIPGWIGCTKDTAVELVGICDASGAGFAAIIYSRVKVGGRITVRFLSAKGRVFSKIGVDLCGPFHIKASAVRSSKFGCQCLYALSAKRCT